MEFKFDTYENTTLWSCNGDDEVVYLPEKTEKIQEKAFQGCKIKKIVIPAKVRYVSAYGNVKRNPFTYIRGLEEIDVVPENKYYCSDGACLYEKHDSGRTLIATANLKNIKISKDVINIRPYIFNFNENLETIEIDPENNRFFIKDGGLYEKYTDFKGIAHISLIYAMKTQKIIVVDKTETIGEAFVNNDVVEEVVLPDTITQFSNDAFYCCINLKSVIGTGVISISDFGHSTCFGYCGKLEKLKLGDIRVIPEGTFECTSFGKKYGFCIIGTSLYKCTSKAYEPLVIPDGVVSILQDSISQQHIKTLVLPDTVRYIDSKAFGFGKISSCLPDKMNIPKGYFDGVNTLEPTMLLAMLTTVWKKECKTEDYVKLLVNQKGKKIFDECCKNLTPVTEDIIQLITDIISDENPQRDYNSLAKFIVNEKEAVSVENANKIADVFEKVDAKEAYKQLVKAGMIVRSEADKKIFAKASSKEQKVKDKVLSDKEIDAQKLANGERPDEKEVIQFVEDYCGKHNMHTEILEHFKENKAVHYRNSHILCDVKVLQALFNEYADVYLRDSTMYSGEYGSRRDLVAVYRDSSAVSKIADYIFGYLNGEELLDTLYKLVHSTAYRFFILTYARFITGDRVSDFIKEIRNEEKGKAKSRYWAENAHEALFVNDTVEAMQYFDGRRCLVNYAAMRGMSAQNLRDLKMVPDFGFDEKGVKRYVAGNIKLAVTIQPDTSIQIFDEVNGKVIKNIPKSGASEEEIEKIKKDFDKFKKEANKYIKDKVSNLCVIHMNRETIKYNVWSKIYLSSPLVKPLSYGLVWCDEFGTTFMPSEKGLVRSDGTLCSINSNVTLADVVNMKIEDIESWQNYLLNNSITQPIEQIWEPVLDTKSICIEKRYNGLHLTAKDRNALKKTLKAKGIDVYSDRMSADYDYQDNNYIFDDHNTMHLGDFINFYYKIEEDKSITIEKGSCNYDKLYGGMRQANAILYELEKLAVSLDIENDDEAKLTADKLSEFTLAQIMDFINTAIKCNSTKCLAVLLEHKEIKFGQTDSLECFSLDLL